MIPVFHPYKGITIRTSWTASWHQASLRQQKFEDSTIAGYISRHTRYRTWWRSPGYHWTHISWKAISLGKAASVKEYRSVKIGRRHRNGDCGERQIAYGVTSRESSSNPWDYGYNPSSSNGNNIRHTRRRVRYGYEATKIFTLTSNLFEWMSGRTSIARRTTVARGITSR